MDANCTDAPHKHRNVVCTKYTDEMCYTRIGKNSIERGCMGDLDLVHRSECTHESNKCATCTTGTKDVACNSAKIKLENCIQCDSEKDEHCRDKPELYKDKICSKFVRFSVIGNREGCYVGEVSKIFRILWIFFYSSIYRFSLF